MVHEMMHIICGNCGQDLTEKNMATWKYEYPGTDEETGEIYDTADVHIKCKNCVTIHFLDDHIKSEEE